MARKPANVEWLGFTDEQARLLNPLDHVGNNGWARNGQSEVLMPNLLSRCAQAGLPLDAVIEAMRSIGYHKDDLHMLERWASKRTTGQLGR